MKFSERVKLAKEYDKWLKEFNESETDFQLKDCALTVITFLEDKGFLRNGFTQLNPEGTRELTNQRDAVFEAIERASK